MEKTAIIIEDTEHFQIIINFILTRAGYKVLHARDGKEASDIIMNKPAPVFVILDLMLPYVDGFQLIKQIRARKEWSEVPIIVLSGLTKEQDIVRALDLGANDFVIKPFRPEELMARVRRCLRTSG